jgi:predicted component of type VI protein secretion system
MSHVEKTVMFAMPNLLSGHLACVAGTAAGRSWELTAGTFTIGRLDEHDMCLSSEPGVSKTHAKIVGQGDHYVLVDCESRNGTLLNGQPIQRAELFDGDEIRICGCLLRFTQVGGRPRRSAPTTPAPTAPAVANDGPPTVAFQAPTAAPPAVATGPHFAPSSLPPTPLAPVAPMPVMVQGPSTGRVLGMWYGAGLVGSLLLGGAASAALVATAPAVEPTPAALVVVAAPEPTPSPAPTPAPAAVVVDAGVADVIEVADAGAVVAEPTPGPDPTPAAAANATVVAPAADAPAEPVVEDEPDDKPKAKRPAASSSNTGGPFAASVDSGHFEVLKSRSGGRVKTALADGAQVAKGTIIVTFEPSADAGEIATLQDRIASLEGVEGDEAKRDLKAARQKLAALEAGQNAAPVVATMDGVLTGFSATPGTILKGGESFGRIVDTSVSARVKVTVARGTRVKSGQRVRMNLKSGGSISGTVVAVNGRVVLVDPGGEPAENVESVSF